MAEADENSFTLGIVGYGSDGCVDDAFSVQGGGNRIISGLRGETKFLASCDFFLLARYISDHPRLVPCRRHACFS